jgi:hypothetical protein
MGGRYSYDHEEYIRKEVKKVEEQEQTTNQVRVKPARPPKPSSMDRETIKILTDDQVQTGG